MKISLLISSVSLLIPMIVSAQGGGVAVQPSSPAVAVPTSPQLLPTNPQSPTDFVAPGRLPAAPQPTGAGGGSSVSGEVEGYSSGDMIITESDPTLYGDSRMRGRKVPSYHLVRKGDKLWSICRHYYGDPWSWPQVWAYNPNITNPHWIYPGDKIKLLTVPEIAPSKGGQEIIRVSGRRGGDQGPIHLRQNGFIDPQEMARAGKIVGSREERILLSEGNEVYIEGNDRFKPQRGNVLSIYRVRKELINSEGKNVGQLVEILGTARIKRVNKDHLATAEILESINSIERNDRVGPLRRRYVRISTLPAQKDLEGTIIALIRDGLSVGTDELVFLDRGSKHGVKPGNRFLVMHKGDGYERLLRNEDIKDSKFPWEVVAEVTILDARDEASVGLVTRSIREIGEGDYVRMRRGY